jgi:hypothetical protein
MEKNKDRYMELLRMDPQQVLDLYVEAVQSNNAETAEELREFITDRMTQANFC